MTTATPRLPASAALCRDLSGADTDECTVDSVMCGGWSSPDAVITCLAFHPCSSLLVRQRC